ncbi:unnamed protein product [Bursaphelenchus xylophilus]|uniref:(pine wood nematode) hypothetical protein n=1 Tax=Bursaphelenchus xylophilus TaxID=6326 RepID=A0A1I7SEF6_BURXY|nr:unnamed protein product [Bursaphelenchus xylophilus]CAG9103994.1 unnamed protein product [Bursaphelenchus xylophilus]
MPLSFEPTEENPNAWDLRPHERHELKPYEEFYLQTIRRVTSQATVFSGMVSFLFFYLVIFRTTGDLRRYKPIFLICSITDITFYMVNTFVQIKAKLKDGVFMVRLEGIAQDYSRNVQLFSVAGFVFALFLAITVLPSQYYYRYYILKYGQALPKVKTVALFSISYMVAIPFGVLAFFAYGYSACRAGFNYGQLWFPEVPLPVVFYADTRSPIMMMYFGVGGSIITAAYLVLLYIGYKTLIHFKSGVYSNRAKSMQKQLTMFLITQSVIPIFVSSGPNVFLVVCCFLRLDPGILTTFVVDLMGLLPICNPVLSIFVIKPYRRTIQGVFVEPKVSYAVTSVSK